MPYFDFVRMAMLPKWRPENPFGQTATMQDTPEQGLASIGGTGGGVIDLPFSISRSIQRNHADEDKRVYDTVRVYYTRPDGTIDYSQSYEIEVVRELSFGNGDKVAYAQPEVAENIELVAAGLTRYNR